MKLRNEGNISSESHSLLVQHTVMDVESYYNNYHLLQFQEEEPVLMKEEGIFHWDFSVPASEFLDDLIEHFSLPPPPAPAPASAFVPYVRPPNRSQYSNYSSAMSIPKRVIGLLRNIPMERPEEEIGVGAGKNMSRCFRHMMRERSRRERQSQSYADLYSMLSSRSKSDKNSIVRSSAVYLKELKATEAELTKKNRELQSRMAMMDENQERGSNCIRLRVSNPSSSIDSMIAAFRYLKGMEINAKTIRSSFSIAELSTTIEIETKIKLGTGEVERSIQKVLMKVEKNKSKQTS